MCVCVCVCVCVHVHTCVRVYGEVLPVIPDRGRVVPQDQAGLGVREGEPHKTLVRWEGGSGWGTHVNPWLIHINVWQKPLQYCKVISLQLI